MPRTRSSQLRFRGRRARAPRQRSAACPDITRGSSARAVVWRRMWKCHMSARYCIWRQVSDESDGARVAVEDDDGDDFKAEACVC